MALEESEAWREREAKKLAQTARILREACTRAVGRSVTAEHIAATATKDAPYGRFSTSWLRGVENARGPYWHNEKKLRSLAWVYGLTYEQLLAGKKTPKLNCPAQKDVPQYLISPAKAA